MDKNEILNLINKKELEIKRIQQEIDVLKKQFNKLSNL